MAKQSLFGLLLTQVQQRRKLAHEQAVAELYRRNKITAGTSGWKLASSEQLNKDGTEIVEYRLYKLVDATVVTISSEVSAQTEDGLKAAKEMKSWDEKQLSKQLS